MELKNEKYETILALASLFDTAFSIDWLVLLTGEKPSVVLACLESAVKEGVLKKKDFSHYSFSQKKRQDKFNKTLDADERERLLHSIVDLFQTELSDSEEKAKLISGYLLELTNDLSQCRRLVDAGDIFLKSFNVKLAHRCYMKVLDDLSHIKGVESDKLFIVTAVKYSRIADVQLDISRVQGLLKTALKRAQQSGDARSTALLEMHIAKNEWYRSNYDEALKRFNKGWAIAQEEDDPRLRRSAVTFSTFFHYWQGYFQEAVNIYEAEISGRQKDEQGYFNLMAESTLGNCYVFTGQTAQGFGMIQSVSSKSVTAGYTFMEAYNSLVMAISLFNIQRFEEALEPVQIASKQARNWPKSPLIIICHLLSAYVFFNLSDNKKTLYHLKKFLALREEIQVSMWPYPYLLELCWAMEEKLLPKVSGLSLDEEISRYKNSKNVFMIGVAHRFCAMKQQKGGHQNKEACRSLKESEKYLLKSGHLVELFRTRLMLSSHYLYDGKEKDAHKIITDISSILADMPTEMIPADLLSARTDLPSNSNLDQFLPELGDKIMDIDDVDDLVQHLLTSAGRAIGAERGGVFVLDKKNKSQKLSLYAALNLTEEQIKSPGFDFGFSAMDEVIKKSKGVIHNQEKVLSGSSHEQIRSLICLPLKVQGKIIGVLYHDNLMLAGAFSKYHLRKLKYFAAMMALAVSHKNTKDELEAIVKGSLEDTHASNYAEQDFGIIGQSQSIKNVLSYIRKVSPTEAAVLILGETGVGKELVARAIHELSSRNYGPFLAVNCNALPDTLISSELFGHEKGAFTGAIKNRQGRFELASEGTIFLDEIGELPMETQSKLLRVLETREFERIGGTKTRRSDFRLITATNRDLEYEIEAGNFRADLFHRINIFPIVVPSLRERKEDIPLLARHFLQKFSIKTGKRFTSFPDSEMEKLISYNWPGNIRELENVIERSVILSQSSIFKLPEMIIAPRSGRISETSEGMTLREMEKQHILRTLDKTNGKVRGPGGAAEILDINPSTLYSRMKKLGISKGRR
jgi:formate hydrogenlyase transcriptional activator